MTTVTIPRLSTVPQSPLDPLWERVPALDVAQFHARSSPHRPTVRAQLGHSGDHLHLRFTVHDRYVVSRTTMPNGPVCTDSCVEFFVEPLPGQGYFNLEINAGGTVHCSHMTDPTWTPNGFAGCHLLDQAELSTMRIATTLPPVIENEIGRPIDWAVCVHAPIALFAQRLGRVPPVPGTWRGNFYKCADHSSHPHWASWAPIGERLAFHVPERFGVLELL
jgi:hypothetical protein